MAINLWYDYVNYNQFINNLVSRKHRAEHIFSSKPDIKVDTYLKYNVELPNFLKRVGVNFNVLVSQSIPYLKNHNWNEKQYFPVELNFFQKSDPINLNFDDSFFLKNAKPNSDFLIWFPREAPEVLTFDKFDIFRKKYPNMRLRFVNGNLKTPKWVNERDFIDYRSFDYFWWIQQCQPRKPLDKNKEEKYTFTFYNHRSKIHRAVPYYSLMKAGKLNDAKHTFHGYASQFSTADEEVNHIIEYSLYREKIASGEPPNEYLDITKNKDFLEWMKSNVTNSFNFDFSNFIDSSLHSESYLDFSTETFSIERPDHFFITEKTYRPIANGCIFLSLSQPGLLKYLKSKGIQTFDDLFDESYDQTTHWFNRWKIIEKNLDIWIKLGKDGRRNYYRKNFDKLQHNQNVIYQRNFRNEIEELLK